MITIVSASIQPMGKVSISIHACLSTLLVIMSRDEVLSFSDCFLINVLFFIHLFKRAQDALFVQKIRPFG